MINDYLFESFSEPERLQDIEGYPDYFLVQIRNCIELQSKDT